MNLLEDIELIVSGRSRQLSGTESLPVPLSYNEFLDQIEQMAEKWDNIEQQIRTLFDEQVFGGNRKHDVRNSSPPTLGFFYGSLNFTFPPPPPPPPCTDKPRLHFADLQNNKWVQREPTGCYVDYYSIETEFTAELLDLLQQLLTPSNYIEQQFGPQNHMNGNYVDNVRYFIENDLQLAGKADLEKLKSVPVIDNMSFSPVHAIWNGVPVIWESEYYQMLQDFIGGSQIPYNMISSGISYSIPNFHSKYLNKAIAEIEPLKPVFANVYETIAAVRSDADSVIETARQRQHEQLQSLTLELAREELDWQREAESEAREIQRDIETLRAIYDN